MVSIKRTRAGSSHKSPARNINRGRRTAEVAITLPCRQLRLQCPFHAKDPDKPREKNSSCQKTGFETPARVVPSEHIRRVHGPIKPSDAATDPNANDPLPGQAPAGCEIERVTQAQLDDIGKLQRKSDPKGKWDDICKILFPGDQSIKPAFMPDAERLRDHARNPPEWLITGMIGAIGASRQEIFLALRNFLVFFDIVCGNHFPLPQSIVTPPPSQQMHFALETGSAMEMELFGAIEQLCPPDGDPRSLDFFFADIGDPGEGLNVGQDF